MITVTSDQLSVWLAMFFWPLVRILAWLSVDPMLGNRSAPVSVRVAFGFALTLAVAPVLPEMPKVPLASGEGLLLLVQQVTIGLCLGFILRLIFAAVEFAGQFMGLQMGLSFATLFDPVNGAQTPVLAQFMVLLTVLILFSSNGHHLVVAAVVDSFRQVPVSAEPMSSKGFYSVLHWSASMFSTGLQIALPVTAAVLASNLAIGMMSRAAPQLNIFAVGFPLTLAAGFFVLYMALGYFPALIERAWAGALQAMAAASHGFVR